MYNDDFINARIIKKRDDITYIPIKMPNAKNRMYDTFLLTIC